MGFLDLIFPKKCLECGSYGRYICGNCVNRVRDGRWSRRINFSIFKYEGVIKKAILALKYRFAYDIAEELAELAKDRLIRRGFRIKAILAPIPLHRMRNNWRGFNQAAEVGRFLSKGMNWEFASNLLSKDVATKPQVGLGSRQRMENLKGSFSVNPNIDISKMGQIIVFDDVYTTGSTMGEAISVFKRKGFSCVFGLTVCG